MYSAEKNIEDFKDKVTTEIVDAIKAAIAECAPPHAFQCKPGMCMPMGR